MEDFFFVCVCVCARSNFFVSFRTTTKKGKRRVLLFFSVLFRNGGESLQDDVDGHQVTAVRTDQV